MIDKVRVGTTVNEERLLTCEVPNFNNPDTNNLLCSGIWRDDVGGAGERKELTV
jgi:hypothetical protein